MASLAGKPQVAEVVVHVGHGVRLVGHDILQPLDLGSERRHIDGRSGGGFLGVSRSRRDAQVSSVLTDKYEAGNCGSATSIPFRPSRLHASSEEKQERVLGHRTN